MTTTFNKIQASENFNHQEEVVNIFSKLGFNELKINTCFTNGISHYIDVLDFVVLDENKLYADMFVFEGITNIEVRISDHTSNLDTICKGVSGNKMNLDAFKKLIENGAISPKQ